MAWKTIHRKSDGKFLEVYNSNGVEGDPSYRGEDARYWNYTHTSEYCDHTVIADRPSEDHVWDDAKNKWREDLTAIEARKETEARAAFAKRDFEERFVASPEKAALK